MNSQSTSSGLSGAGKAATQPSHIDKPTALYNEIQYMRALTEKLERLYARVCESPQDVGREELEPRGNVCLLEVLAEGPRIIVAHLEMQHQILNDLDRALFDV